MKKILMTMVAVFAAMNMNAQVYVGGSVGFGSAKMGSGDSESTYKILPEIGYNLNSEWAIGVALGYQKGTCNFGDFDFNPGKTQRCYQPRGSRWFRWFRDLQPEG